MDKYPVDIGHERSGFIHDLMIQISQSASTTHELAGLFHLISHHFRESLSADHFLITLQNSHRNSTYIIFADNQYLPDPNILPDYPAVLKTSDQHQASSRTERGKKSAGRSAFSGFEQNLLGVWMNVPLSLIDEKVRGSMLIQSTSRKEPYSEDERNSVQLVASQAAIAIYRNKTELWREIHARQFQGVLSKAPVGMHLYAIEPSHDLILTGYNPAADQVLQIDHSFLMGKTIEEVIPDFSDTDLFEQFRWLAREGGAYQTDQVLYDQGQIHKAYQVHAFQTEPGKIAAMFVEISDQKRMEESLRMRDGILSSAVFAAEQFLESHNWKEKIQVVLERLGEVTESSRIFLAENHVEPDGETRAVQTYEWRIPSLAEVVSSPWVGEFSFKDVGFSRWEEALQNGEVIHRLVRNLAKNQAESLDRHKILSIAMAPIMIQNKCWGVIGFENHVYERMFSRPVIDSLKAAANTVSSAIQRTQKENSLYEKAARIDSLVKTAARLNTRLDPESVIDTVCTEAALNLKASLVTIYLYNDESRALHCAGGFNLTEDCFTDFEAIPLQTLNHFLNLKGNPILLQDPDSIQKFFHAPVHEFLDWQNIVTWAILFDQKLIGILNIVLEAGQRILNSEELDFLEGLTHEAGLAINNARLLLDEKIRTKELATLYDLSVNLNTSLSVEESLEITLSGIQDLLEADAGLIVLQDASKATLSIPFATGFLAANIGYVYNWLEYRDRYFEVSGKADTSFELPSIMGLFSELKGIKLCSSAATIPLLSGNETVGIVLAAHRKNSEPEPLSPFDQRLLRAVGELAGTTVRKAQFYEDGQRRLTFLQSLRTIDLEISTNLELDSTLRVVLDEVLANLQVDAAGVLTIDPATGKLQFSTQKGFLEPSLYMHYLEQAESYAELAAFDRRMFLLPDTRNKQTNFTHSKLFKKEKFIAYVAVPLLAKGQVRGVMEVFGKKPFSTHQEWLEFLETLAGQTAIAIEHTSLFEDLQHKNIELVNAYDITIEGWSMALDLKDSDTEGHTRRVAELTERLALALGVPEEELIHLRRGALLHDIGKMGVPDKILRKPGPLNDEEWVVMKQHPVYAYNWLSPAEYLRPALDIPYCHHEKWDGSGYPQGLKETEIPLNARIFSLVDVWDALSSDRPYRERWPREEVIEYIHRQSRAYFDPDIVPVFLEILKNLASFN